MARIEEGKKRFMFRDFESGKLFESVELVVVKGDWDTKTRKYLDPPTIESGYGNTRPSKIAQDFGINRKDVT